MNYYYLNGLNIKSEILLPPLDLQPASQPDVVINLNSVPLTIKDPIKQAVTFMINHNAVLIRLPKIARFLIENGTNITIEPDPDCPLDDLCCFITGVAWTVINYQRGCDLLKGTLIELNQKTWLISGVSPIGSSTFSLAMNTYLGAKIISDDFCSYHHINQDVIVNQGMPALKLWQNTLKFFDYDSSELTKIRTKLNKFWLPNNVITPTKIIPMQTFKLEGIIGLQQWRSDDKSMLGVKRLSGFSALKRAYHHGTHRVYLNASDSLQRKFNQDLQLVQQCKILSFTFNREWSSLKSDCELLAHQLMNED